MFYEVEQKKTAAKNAETAYFNVRCTFKSLYSFTCTSVVWREQKNILKPLIKIIVWIWKAKHEKKGKKGLQMLKLSCKNSCIFYVLMLNKLNPLETDITLSLTVQHMDSDLNDAPENNGSAVNNFTSLYFFKLPILTSAGTYVCYWTNAGTKRHSSWAWRLI